MTTSPILRGGVYLLNGRPLDRVTTVLNVIAKPGLEAWRRRVGMEEAERISRTAADWGTGVHKAVEAGLATGTYGDPGTPEQRAAVETFATWAATLPAGTVMQPEVRVWHERHGYAGTADIVVDTDTEAGRVLVDLKTSAHVDHLYRLQTAAYVAALEEMGHHIDRRWIVHIPRARPDRLTLVHLDEDARDMRRDILAWESILRLYRWQKRVTAPKQGVTLEW